MVGSTAQAHRRFFVIASTRLALAATLLLASACGGGGGGGGGGGPLNGFDATYLAANTVGLEWTNEAEGATNIVVRRSTDSGGPFDDIATIAGDAVEYTDATIALETRYYYRVAAVGGADDGAESKVASPGAPIEIPQEPEPVDAITTSVVSPGGIDVSWTHSGENVMGFRLERLMNFVGFNYVLIADLPATARSYQDTCLRPESPFLYRVTAYNEAGATAVLTTPANTFTPAETAAPAVAPSGLTAEALTADSYRISWTNACSQAQLIEVQVSVMGGAYTNVLGAGVYFSSDAFDFYYIDLPQNSFYDFQVRAFNDLGTTAFTAPLRVTGPTVAEPVTGGWVGIHADYDNRKIYSDLLEQANNTAYPNGELVVGCFWSLNTFLGIQNFNCYSSAVHFPLSGTSTGGSAFNLAGKTIDQAVLVLNVYSVPINPTNIQAHAISSTWNTGTLTGLTSLNLYSAGGRLVGSPGIYGAYGIDVTEIVQNWANGTFQNNGILLEDAEYVFPYDSLIRTSFFWSTDTYNNNPNFKPTLWVEYR